jgi:hypothetical protein
MLKTCNGCREKQKKYREQRQRRVLVDFEKNADEDDELTQLSDIDKLMKSKLNDNIKLMYKLAMHKYGIKFFIDCSVNEKEGLFTVYHIECDKDNFDAAYITITEQIKWKQIKRRFEKIKEGVSKTCSICLEDKIYKISCNECAFDYCAECMVNIVKTTSLLDKCPCCRYTQPFNPNCKETPHDLYFNGEKSYKTL